MTFSLLNLLFFFQITGVYLKSLVIFVFPLKDRCCRHHTVHKFCLKKVSLITVTMTIVIIFKSIFLFRVFWSPFDSFSHVKIVHLMYNLERSTNKSKKHKTGNVKKEKKGTYDTYSIILILKIICDSFKYYRWYQTFSFFSDILVSTQGSLPSWELDLSVARIWIVPKDNFDNHRYSAEMSHE